MTAIMFSGSMRKRLRFSFLAHVLVASALVGAFTGVASAVTIASPAQGATISKKCVVKVDASGDSGITNICLKIDGATYTNVTQGGLVSFQVDTRLLRNGVHTLQAVARSAANVATSSSVITLNVTNAVQYTLGTQPFTIENLGSPMAVNTQERQRMFRLPGTGDIHLLLFYDVVDVWAYPLQILDVNLSTSTARLTDGILGRPGAYGTVLHTNGLVYIGSGDPGYLMEYNPVTGSTILITKLHPTLRRDTQTMDIGDDGRVYIGEYSPLGGGVGAYNPTTRTFEDLGLVDTNFAAAQYSYTIGADKRFVYVGLGQSPWYLGIVDTDSKQKQLYWKDQADSSGSIYHGTNGGWYYYRITSDSVKHWYLLTNGTPLELSSQNIPPASSLYAPWLRRPNLAFDISCFASDYNVEINLDQAYPDSGNNQALVKWRTVGALEWNSVKTTRFRLQPVNIKRLYSQGGSTLLGFADFYGPVFLYDVGTRTITSLGRPQYSLYDAVFELGKVYLSGYAAVTLAYNSGKPWTLAGSTLDKSSVLVNPYKTSAGFGKYHYYSAFGADGLLYVGAHHERDSTGGELGWYNPQTGAGASLRTPFLNDDVRDLKPALGGTKLVYSGNQDKLFVFDTDSKTIERTITPIPGVQPLDKIVEVEPGVIFGATSNWVFKVDITSGKILYTNTIPGQAFGGSAISAYDRRIVLGPDGFIWMFVGTNLCRLNPLDGSAAAILTTSPKNIVFNGCDMYLYGGASLFRVSGILQDLTPLPPTELRANGM